MAKKRQRNGLWHYTIQARALLPRPYYFSAASEREGDAIGKRIEAALAAGVIPPEVARVMDLGKGSRASIAAASLRAAVARYRDAQHTAPDDARLLKISLARLPESLALKDLNFAWAAAWVTQLKREYNMSPSTIRHHVGALARALDWIAAHNEIPANPLRQLAKGYATYTPEDIKAVKRAGGKVKESASRDRRLEEGEEPRIRRVMAGENLKGGQRPLELREQDSLCLLFDMALESAMRLREMYTLEWSQIELTKRTIFLDRTKNGNKRQVPISTPLMALLKSRRKTKFNGDFVFPWWNGDRSDKVLRDVSQQMSRQFTRIFEAADCADLHFHDLRHEATSRFYELTKLSDLEIMSITGHSSMGQLKRYANLRGSSLALRLW